MIRPDQVLFHPLKHHLQTIIHFIRTGNQQPFSDSLKQIKTMGASQFDLYTGLMMVENITSEIAAQLHTAGITSEEQYREWIGNNGGHRTRPLSDGSEWTLRYLPQPSFVHIHPSRYALHTIRIKANAMKTVCCYLLLHGGDHISPDIAALNQVRIDHLDLSPISLQNSNEEIDKVYMLLRNGLLKQ